MLKLEVLQLKSPVKLKINVKYVLPEDEQKKLKEEVLDFSPLAYFSDFSNN